MWIAVIMLVHGSHSLLHPPALGNPGVVKHRSAHETAANGHSTRVASLRAGDCFGEMSLLNGEPRSATIVARSDCDVVEIGKGSMAELLQRSPELLHTLSEMLARRRVENEGVLAASAQARTLAETQKQYTATFLQRLRSLFEL